MKSNPFNLRLLCFSALLTIAACGQPAPDSAENQTVPIDNNPVAVAVAKTRVAFALPDPYSADEVQKVLENGGNAVDASVTAAFVLAVTFPTAGNIGGGGFLLARMNDQLHFLDYREKAPLAASRDMFIGEDGMVAEKASLVGIRTAGVPGTVAGIWEAHQKFGTKPWAELIAPAIRLAEEGFEVHAKTIAELDGIEQWFEGKVNFMQHFGALLQGGVFKQPMLADTLRRIAEQGPEDFYQGETARLLLAQMERDGGLMTAQDLLEYKPVWREPLTATWQDYTVVSAPPPSSGGFAVIHLLKMKELLAQQFTGVAHNSAQYVHLIAEMEKRVFADRAVYFGDPDFVEIPMAEIMSDDYIARRASEVNAEQISDLGDVKAGIDSPSTTHFSIIDQWGNAVSNTYTINWSYGSGVVVEGAGFLLNNEMDDFSTKPGFANVYGVVGGTANEIQPSKRMLSSMSPSMLLKDGEVAMVVGTPGGSTIFTSVFQTIVNVIDYDMTADQAVGASRFHHQLLPPDLITTSISLPLPEATKTELKQRGYRVEPHGWEFGNVQLVMRKDGKLSAAADPRGYGKANVVNVPDSAATVQ